MTKIELIEEMYNVIINNADVFNYPEKHMTEYYADKVRTTKKAELEKWLAKLNAMVEKAKKEETIETVETEAETVETEVEKNIEYVAEPKATKKDIIMGLYKDGSVECDLTTAEALAQEGFIIIDRYEDGMLYGFIFWDAVEEEVMDEDEMMIFLMAHSGFENWGEGYKIMKELYSKGYLVDWVEDEEKERCYANQNTDKVLSDFCNRWDNKLD